MSEAEALRICRDAGLSAPADGFPLTSLSPGGLFGESGVVALYALLCLIWGSTWLGIKLGLRDLPPITFAAARFLLAVAILRTCWGYKREQEAKEPDRAHVISPCDL